MSSPSSDADTSTPMPELPGVTAVPVVAQQEEQVGMEVDAPQQAPTAELGTSGQEAEQGQAQAQEQPQEQPQAQQPQEQQQQGQQQQGQEQQGKAQEQAPAQPPMSKNKMKKLAKLERMLQQRAERKAQEKAAKVEARQQRKETRQANVAAMTPEELAAHKAQVEATKAERRKEAEEQRNKMTSAMQPGNQRVVIDLDFEGMMPEGDLRSLCQQLSYSYSSNKRAAKPLHLHFLGFKGSVAELSAKLVTGMPNWHITKSEQGVAEFFAGKLDEVVYLTADSDVELKELDPTKAYVIGGIVDHNKHKGLCLKRAQAAGIATARLPIQKYVQLEASSVLAVNHVMQILVEKCQGKEWAAVLDEVLPKRKRADYKSEKAEKGKEGTPEPGAGAGPSKQDGAGTSAQADGAGKADKEAAGVPEAVAAAGPALEAVQEAGSSGAGGNKAEELEGEPPAKKQCL